MSKKSIKHSSNSERAELRSTADAITVLHNDNNTEGLLLLRLELQASTAWWGSLLADVCYAVERFCVHDIIACTTTLELCISVLDSSEGWVQAECWIVYILRGHCYGIAADFDSAFAMYQRVSDFAALLDNARLQINSIRYKGLTLYNRGRYEDALRYFSEALTLCYNHNADTAVVVELTDLCSRTLQVLGDFEKALSLSMDALILSEKLPPSQSLASTYTSIGSMLSQKNKHSEALAYFHMALDTSRAIGFDYGVAHAQYMLGTMYHNIGAQNLAVHHASDSLRVCTQSVMPQIVHVTGLVYLLLAKIFLALEKYSEAFEYSSKSLEIAQSIQFTEEISAIHICRGAIRIHEGKYLLAEQELLLALECAEKSSLKPNQESALRHLAWLWEIQQDAARSRSYRQQADALHNEMLGEHFTHAFENFFKEYESRKRAAISEVLGLSNDAILDSLYQRASEQAPRYTWHAEEGNPSIVVHTLGKFSVRVNGRVLQQSDWQRKKARDVFKLLLIQYRRAVPAEQIIETIWGDTSADAIGSLRNAVSFIRTALEPHLSRKEPSTYLKNIDGAYILDLGLQAWIDTHAFNSAIEKAEQTPDAHKRFALWEEAITLYEGDFLPEETLAEWTCFMRDSLRDTYIRALLGMARYSAEHNNNSKAIDLLRTILSTDKTHEEAYKVMITIAKNSGNANELQRVIEQCKSAFTSEYGSEPHWLQLFV